MDAAQLRAHAQVESAAARRLLRLYETGAISPRGHQRLVRVARTLADLAERDPVGEQDVLAAISLRGHAAPEAEVAA
jgi:magnesium chelatase family protein